MDCLYASKTGHSVDKLHLYACGMLTDPKDARSMVKSHHYHKKLQARVPEWLNRKAFALLSGDHETQPSMTRSQCPAVWVGWIFSVLCQSQ